MNQCQKIIYLHDGQSQTSEWLEQLDLNAKFCESTQSTLTSPELNQTDLLLIQQPLAHINPLELCQRLRQDSSLDAMAIIFISENYNPRDEALAKSSGANGYICNLVSPEHLKSQIDTQLALHRQSLSLAKQVTSLEASLRNQLHQVLEVQKASLNVMISMAAFRDKETGSHILRTQMFVKELVEQLLLDQPFHPDLSAKIGTYIIEAAPLHDIGKITVPDKILLKPGKLSPDEFEIMKSHTTEGATMIRQAAELLKDQNEFLQVAERMVNFHHERWDGSGYPEGLQAEQIPLSARILAVADVYDALVSKRPYKRAFTHNETVSFINQASGTHFDPMVVEAFNKRQKAIQAITLSIQDDVETPVAMARVC